MEPSWFIAVFDRERCRKDATGLDKLSKKIALILRATEPYGKRVLSLSCSDICHFLAQPDGQPADKEI